MWILFYRDLLDILLDSPGVCPPSCNVTFKIINRLKVNNDNLKLNSDFKNYIIIKRTS
jgi:hypothetical protein